MGEIIWTLRVGLMVLIICFRISKIEALMQNASKLQKPNGTNSLPMLSINSKNNRKQTLSFNFLRITTQ